MGKISDIFAGQGITEAVPSKSNQQGMDRLVELLAAKQEDCLIFVNLVDFDMLWGHRNNVEAYAQGLEEFDARLPEIKGALQEGDLLFILADHGCDPTTISTDHSRSMCPCWWWARGWSR